MPHTRSGSDHDVAARAIDETGIETLAAFRDRQSTLQTWATKNDAAYERLRVAVHIELCDRQFPGVRGTPGAVMNHSLRRELQRLAPLGLGVVEQTVEEAKRNAWSVRALRDVVDERLAKAGPVQAQRAFGGAGVAARFEARAFAAIDGARNLFADERAVLARVERGAALPADFVLKDGTGVLAAFECKAPSKSVQPRRMLELAAVQALIQREVPECYAVFSSSDHGTINSYRSAIERFELDHQHVVMLSDSEETPSVVEIVVERRDGDEWMPRSRIVTIGN